MPTIIRNGRTYGGGGGSGNTSNKYSTEEQVIGTWIDGKPIYRKVYANETVGQVNVDVTDLHIDRVIRVDGIVNTDGAQSLVSSISANHQRNVAVSNNNTNMYYYTSNGADLVKYFIIEYTKTTD